MEIALADAVYQLNPWLKDPTVEILNQPDFIPRLQTDMLLMSEWDKLWTILTGPRQAGKTTLGKHLCQRLIQKNRFKSLLYLNCDFLEIRNWLRQGPRFISQAMAQFKLKRPIIFIDEAQRLENPGLLLKAMVDLQLPAKLMASGSSQLEIKSAIQEHLTGRHLESIVLPFSRLELNESNAPLDQSMIFGAYPGVIQSSPKRILLNQLYKDYISKDIIEILRIGKPDVMQSLIGLMAHCAGQLVNYQQLAADCRVTIPTIQNYLSILEKTFVLRAIKPFVGNKRTEITTNPIYYFIDNGFRNEALKNFSSLENRSDNGLLVENFVFQELLKYKTQHFRDWDINFWRTKSGAEVDFVLKCGETIIPVEVKYRTMRGPKITRGFRSFLHAYKPSQSIIITKSFTGREKIENCEVNFLALEHLPDMFGLLDAIMP